MTEIPIIDLLPAHASFWNQFEASVQKKKLAHAILLIGPLHTGLSKLACRMASAIFCKQVITPCGKCQSCQLIILGEHPDLILITPEKSGAAIKIEQIRGLQTNIYTSPQISENRVVIINPAQNMNGSSANALLKILEEPPLNTYFILITEHISTIPATILSRCQQWRISSPLNCNDDYLVTQGMLYTKESSRGIVFQRCETIINNLVDLLCGKMTVNAIAAQWVALEFNDLIWLLYLINTQMVKDNLLKFSGQTALASELFNLSQRLKPICLFAQLDKLNGIIRNLNQSISVNQLLVLEDFLLGYLKNERECR